MNLGKAAGLCCSIVALASFCAPAFSSAHVWTDDGAPLEEFALAPEPFEGLVTVTIPKGLFSPHSTISCPLTLEIGAEGPAAGRILRFDGTTAECGATGTYLGCAVVEDATNLGSEWSISVAATPITIKKAGSGNITLRYVFNGCTASPLHLEFASITVTPTLNGAGTITQLSLSGTATSGGVTISGTLTPEQGSTTLGLK